MWLHNRLHTEACVLFLQNDVIS